MRCAATYAWKTCDVVPDKMNTYYLVPAAQYHPKVPRRDFDGITESIVSNPELDKY